MYKPQKKVLPIKIPVNTTWTWNTGLMSILENYNCTNAWVFSNYIQLYCKFNQDNKGKIFIDFTHLYGTFHDCPWLTIQTLSREFINIIISDIKEFFINCIVNDNYIFGIFDENCFLKNTDSKNKFLHELFIFGYDCKTEMFDVADFTFAKTYSFNKVSFKKLVNAYNNVKPNDNLYGIEFVIARFNENGSYNIDNLLIKQNLQNYINSTMPYDYTRINSNPPTLQFVYGLNVYDCLIEHLNSLVNGTTIIDEKPFHLIYIHKITMVLRIKFLVENGYLSSQYDFIEEFEQIQKIAQIIRNKYIIYSINRKHSIIEEIIVLINNLKIKEAEIIQHLLSLM